MPDSLPGAVHQLRLELLAQVLLAVVLGGLVGIERELKGKPAGLRTNVLICVGATLFTVLSLHVAEARGDPGRIAHRENVDLVVELEIREPKRQPEQALVSIVHHPGVRSVSTGE